MIKLNRRVKLKRWSTTQDNTGGLIGVQASSWDKWAGIEDKSGSNFNPNMQQLWSYDYKVTMRYESSRPTHSNDTIDYNGMRLKVENISIKNEGFKHLEVCRCSTVDILITGS